MGQIHILFSRFSAFYSPLIATMAGGFLAEEGLEASHGLVPAGGSALASLREGRAQVAQSAVSQGFTLLERGGSQPARHFAQINEMDGFFLTARAPDPDFQWSGLAGRRVLVDHGGQPLAMFKYACHRRGLDYDSIEAIDAGGPEQMDLAFRQGVGDLIHQQGPAPQQLAQDCVGSVVASVGEAIGPCAFSSLMALEDWLESDMAKAFMRAYRKARAWVIAAPPEEIAAAEAGFFPEIDQGVLTETIGAYQRLGCWTPRVEITPEAYEAALDVFLHAGLITRRHPFDQVVTAPPP